MKLAIRSYAKHLLREDHYEKVAQLGFEVKTYYKAT